MFTAGMQDLVDSRLQSMRLATKRIRKLIIKAFKLFRNRLFYFLSIFHNLFKDSQK